MIRATLRTRLLHEAVAERSMQEVAKLIADQAEETRRHFDVVAENIHKDVADANADEISRIKDQQLPDHENRIVGLEKHTGLPVGFS